MPISPRGESFPPTMLKPSDLWPTPLRNVIDITHGDAQSSDESSSSGLRRSNERLFRFSLWCCRYLLDLLFLSMSKEHLPKVKENKFFNMKLSRTLKRSFLKSNNNIWHLFFRKYPKLGVDSHIAALYARIKFSTGC